MIRSSITNWAIVSCFGLSLAFAGCSGDTTSTQQTGSLNLNLELADGVVINEVDWTISGGDMDPMSGTIDTSAPGATASVEVFGLPPGQGYLVELQATDETGEITCGGDAQFDVEVGVSTDVMVFLNCKLPTTLGGVRVNGKFNICAELAKVVVSPLQTSVGNDIDLSAQTIDVEGDPVAIMWSGTGGSVADPSADQTTYTCATVGPQSITIVVSDDDFESCMDDWTVAVTCVEGAGDLCEGVTCEDDGNECTAAACNPATGQCETSNVADGTECDGGAGTCQAGECTPVDLCEGVDCDDQNECTADACNPADGSCSNTPVEDGTECDGGAGTCQAGECTPVDLCEGVDCDDQNECTADACNPADGSCSNTPVADGTECDGGAGTCNAGVCEPAAEACLYQQDFESMVPGDPPQSQPTSLADDGWVVGANVFGPDGTTFLYNYFAFPAPNGGPAFSAVAVGEGGPEQGEQQLSVYNDYNNTDHAVGNIIEAIVFRERTIEASDVGTTLVFQFDAKKGNIVPPTTAAAFIKTIAGSDTTNALFVDTTNLPDTWGTFTISLPIVSELVGQKLQIGFQSRATNYDSSGIFYDNITLGPEGCSGNGGGGGGELAINGDFETGDATGWLTDFVAPNNGTFTVTSAQSNGGTYSGNLVASVPAEGGPASFPLIKQANIGIGTVQPNSTVEISFDLFGSVSGAGGVFFAEFFSELSGGGTSKSEILGGGPLFPTGTWTTYSFTTTTGPDVSGGVTLQLKTDCGANAGCTVDAYIDNVSVVVP